MSKAAVLGADVGYSNLKLVWGSGPGGMQTKVVPSGAAPLSAMPQGESGPSLAGGHIVHLPDGQIWVGGIPHSAPQGKPRTMAHNYPETDDYLAAFLAGLKHTGLTEIDRLVTGLPVSQFYADNRAAARRLKERLKGVKFVDRQHAVHIKDVDVVPQPVGACWAAKAEHFASHANTIRVLTIDPGWFSMDWCCVEADGVRDQSSGSSDQATSRVMEIAAANLRKAGASSVGIDSLENLVRKGERTVLAKLKPLDVAPYIDAAAGEVAGKVVADILGSIRGETRGFDAVVLAGGGAQYFEQAVRRHFAESSSVVVPVNPVMANARGYYYIGRIKEGVA